MQSVVDAPDLFQVRTRGQDDIFKITDDGLEEKKDAGDLRFLSSIAQLQRRHL